ncbi:MAG: thiamine phosphate synthase [Paludibacter sp.]|nr:thiamine phosphate synthase [Paludibacter sp.]
MILITNPQAVPHEMELIDRLFKAGLQTLHVRKPTFEKSQLKQFISKIDKRFHCRIMIHNEYKLLEQFQLKGIHFTEKTKFLVDDYARLTCCKSMAVHNLDQLKTIPPTIDYVFLSPLFPSVSKEGYAKDWDFEKLKIALEQKRKFKIAALGGITLENVQTVRALGFDDFVLLGSIWNPALEGSSLNEIINLFNQYKNE